MYDVQLTTDFGETIVLTIDTDSVMIACATAIGMVESGSADTIGRQVVDYSAM